MYSEPFELVEFNERVSNSLEVLTARRKEIISFGEKLDSIESMLVDANPDADFEEILYKVWLTAYQEGLQEDSFQEVPPSMKDFFRKEVIAKFFKDIKNKAIGLIPKSRLMTIAKTEVTKAFNRGRIASMETNGVSHVLFLAIEDGVTTDICRSRNGMVLRVGSAAYKANTPPLHFNCRSTLTPLPSDSSLIKDRRRSPERRLLTPLMEGW